MMHIKLNGKIVATAEQSSSGIFYLQLGINPYADESLERLIKYLEVYGTVEIDSNCQHTAPSHNEMQNNLNAAARAWGTRDIQRGKVKAA